MGVPMCVHLLNEGYNVLIYNRTKSKAEILLDSGANWATPEEIIK